MEAKNESNTIKETAQHFKIKDWPAEDRPREKLLRWGASTLADAELLAILIRTGSGKCTALDLARQILHNDGNLRTVGAKTPPELMRMKGIGEAKAVQLLAAFEIGRRVQGAKDEEKLIVRSPEDVAHFMIPKLRDKTNEVFVVLLLDSKNGIKREVELSQGTLNASLVHPREVYKAAIDNLAASIIVVHNHPSGNKEPSKEDIEITRQLVETGKIVGIPLNDHLIIAGSSYTSFAERGLV